MSQYHNSVLQSTTPYDKVLQSTTLLYYSVLLSTKVLRSITKYYTGLLCTTVFLRTTKYDKVLQCTTP